MVARGIPNCGIMSAYLLPVKETVPSLS
jgi:hypothetical protein